LLVVYVLTRAVVAWLAHHPETYGAEGTVVTGDPARYEAAADAVLDGAAPYSEVAIEYPPGSLPFLLAPSLGAGAGVSYRASFIAAMLCVDALGLVGVARIARSGSALGQWLWIALPVVLGPIVFVRLDLVPAVATIWALERAAVRSWPGAGAWLGYGAIVKLYPAVLLPATWVASGRRARVPLAAAVVAVIPLLPLATSLGDVWVEVVGYHLDRGIQVESTWGAGLLLASRLGHEVSIGYNFGAFHAASEIAPALEAAAAVLSVAFVAGGAVLAGGGGGDVRGRLVAALVATLAGVLVVGTVLSPQYVVWLAALAACWVASGDRSARAPALLVVLAAALSQVIYPFLYTDLLSANAGAILALAARNALIGAVALCAVRAARSPDTALA
jgi:hypothetical protein